jgi:AcrR family transcriptional regulator
VSRATAYRYFSSVEALLVEAAVDVSVPGASDIFEQQPTDDPAARLVQVDQAIHDFVLENELQLRLVLAHTIEQGAKKNEVPVRQDRRTPLIEAALAPAGKRFKQSQLNHLKAAAAMIIGTEGMLVARDVLQLDDRKARRVKRWAIQALVDSALRQSKNT